MTKSKAIPKSHGHLYEEDIQRMIADWLTWSEQQRRVADLTHSALARSNAERYARLAQQARELLDAGATFYSPPTQPVAVGTAFGAPPPLAKKARATKARRRPTPALPGLRCLSCGKRISRLEWDEDFKHQENFRCCEASQLETEITDGE